MNAAEIRTATTYALRAFAAKIATSAHDTETKLAALEAGRQSGEFIGETLNRIDRLGDDASPDAVDVWTAQVLSALRSLQSAAGCRAA